MLHNENYFFLIIPTISYDQNQTTTKFHISKPVLECDLDATIFGLLRAGFGKPGEIKAQKLYMPANLFEEKYPAGVIRNQEDKNQILAENDKYNLKETTARYIVKNLNFFKDKLKILPDEVKQIIEKKAEMYNQTPSGKK